MKLEIGETIDIKGKIATVCYETKHNDINYICVAIEEDKVLFEIYKYKFDGEKLLVSLVTDELELFAVLKIFVQEGLEEYELPDELSDFYNKIAEKYNKKEDNNNGIS